MSKILFVKANNRLEEQAVSVKLSHAFLNSYKESHPEDDITELDLFNEQLPYLNVSLINGAFKSSRGMPLSSKEQHVTDLPPST